MRSIYFFIKLAILQSLSSFPRVFYTNVYPVADLQVE